MLKQTTVPFALMLEPASFQVSIRLQDLISYYGRMQVEMIVKSNETDFKTETNAEVYRHVSNLKTTFPEAFLEMLDVIFPIQKAG